MEEVLYNTLQDLKTFFQRKVFFTDANPMIPLNRGVWLGQNNASKFYCGLYGVLIFVLLSSRK